MINNKKHKTKIYVDNTENSINIFANIIQQLDKFYPNHLFKIEILPLKEVNHDK